MSKRKVGSVGVRRGGAYLRDYAHSDRICGPPPSAQFETKQGRIIKILRSQAAPRHPGPRHAWLDIPHF